MADVVNLRRFRKAQLRAAKAVAADTNRARFGRCRAERLAAEEERLRSDALLDGHRRDPPGHGVDEPLA
jgi:hypothetical protein